ncbi:uncharacterized protein LOC142165926 [Nicotiana tabacum]|uniref:Uncharacterized protein LOC142165926 n=1 Tax=Nicotiana tabacum TaxID=4097 RepID=A0AC58S606_TOBAC
MIHQQKYIKELLKKFNMDSSKSVDTPIDIVTKLDLNEEGKNVEQNLYRGMIGSPLYLTASMPGIMFSVGLCARFQVFMLTGKALLEQLTFYILALCHRGAKKQNSAALSTAEAQYMATTSCYAQLLPKSSRHQFYPLSKSKVKED